MRLAERRLVQRRKAEPTEDLHVRGKDTGLENCRIAHFDKGKVIRVTAAAGQTVHVMGLHENIHEFCYVLSGRVDLRVEDRTFHLGPDDTILFDGLLDHSYVQREAGEYITVHIPKTSAPSNACWTCRQSPRKLIEEQGVAVVFPIERGRRPARPSGSSIRPQ